LGRVGGEISPVPYQEGVKMKKFITLIPLLLLCQMAKADMFTMGEPTIVVMSGTTITGTAIAGTGNSLVGWTKLTGSDQFSRLTSVYEESGKYDVLITTNPLPYTVVSDYAVGWASYEKVFRFTPPQTAGTYTGTFVSLTFTTFYTSDVKPKIKYEAYK
jgi:hypothetical protein